MPNRTRFYDALLHDHLAQNRQMAFVSGPRQVGKTTTCRAVATHYLNWDNQDDRRRLVAGPTSLTAALELEQLRAKVPVAVLDELHKYGKWKNLMKGFVRVLRHLRRSHEADCHRQLPARRISSGWRQSHGTVSSLPRAPLVGR